MPTQILIPTPLRPFTDKLDTVEVDGQTVGELLQGLTTRYGALKNHLYSADGRLRSFVNVYVNDEDIRYLQKEDTPLQSGDVVSIIPSVAGGSGLAAAPALPQLSPDEVQRYSRHLILSEVGMDGQRAPEGREGAVHRRRRAGVARCDVSGRGGCRHDRHRRLRRGRPQQPPAAAAARHAGRGPPEARFREGPAARR